MRNISYQENFPVKRFGRMSFIVFLLATSMIFFSSIQSAYAAAVTIQTIPAGASFVQTNRKFPLKMSNCTSVNWKGVTTGEVVNANGDVLYKGDGSFTPDSSTQSKDGCYAFCIYLNSKGKAATTKSDFLELTFSNVGEIGGESIDCVVHFDYAKFSKKLGTGNFLRSDGYAAVCRVTNSALWISTDDGCAGFAGRKQIKVTTTMKYHDTGEKINLPFFQAIRDIDTHGNYYDEAWQPGDGDDETWSNDNGFEPIIHKYKENTCKFNTTTGRVTTTGTSTSSAEDQIKKTGVYIRTKGGKFTSTFLAGNCAATFEVYSEYSATSTLELPTLAVDKETAKPKNTITYTVSQKIGTFYSTVMKPYDKIVFTDVVPNEVTYKSAKMLDGNGNDITNQGTLTYDSGTRTVKFVMGDTWRNKESNYNGQTLKLVISTTANRFKGSKITITNQAKVSLADAVTNDTNTVKTEMDQWGILDKSNYIQLRIRIPKDKDQQTEAHGKPTFIFKVTGKGNGKTYYDSVTFGDPDESVGWTFKEDGDWIVATGMKTKVPEDVYTADYVQVSRFKVTAEPPMVMDAENEDSYVLFPFEATKKTWQYYSHNNIVINQLMKK